MNTKKPGIVTEIVQDGRSVITVVLKKGSIPELLESVYGFEADFNSTVEDGDTIFVRFVVNLRAEKNADAVDMIEKDLSYAAN